MTLATHDLDVRLGGRRVIEGMAANVAPGEILAVAGPNGAGKSTLLKAMAGLLAPAAGTVSLDGAPIQVFDRRALGRAQVDGKPLAPTRLSGGGCRPIPDSRSAR